MKFFKVIILSVALTVVWSSGDNLEDYDQDSQDSQESQESQDDHVQDQDQEHPMLPPHEFIVKKTMWQTGKKKGEEKFSVTLEVAPYIFRKKKDTKKKSGGLILFCCCRCESLGVNTLAHARKYLGENGPSFCLETFDFDHKCAPSSVQDLVFRFIQRLYQAVEDDPLKSMNAIYEETRSEFTRPLDQDSQIIFLQDIPSLVAISANLYRKRREFIPREPKCQSDFDTSAACFLINRNESCVKIDETKVDGKRIVGFSSNVSLEILA
jgi:hypothetical protein